MNILQDVISKFSPILATAIAGPAGGIVTSIISELFGAKDQTPEQIANVISKDPEASFKLAQLELQLTQAFLADTQNARAREEELAKLGAHDWVLPAISMAIIIGFYIVVAIIMFSRFDKTDHDVLYLLVGTLGAAFTQVINYYLGTSVSEQKQIKFPDPKK